MGDTDSWALPTWPIRDGGCRLLWPPLLYIWCYSVQQLTSSSNTPSRKGQEQGLWWYLFIHCCCCCSSQLRKAYTTQKKKMVQLPSRSVYITTWQTYLRRIFFFKKQDVERRRKDKIGVLIRKRTYNVCKEKY